MKKTEKRTALTGIEYRANGEAVFKEGTQVFIKGTCKADSFSVSHPFEITVNLTGVPVKDVLPDFATNLWISRIQKMLRTWGNRMESFRDASCHYNNLDEMFANPDTVSGTRSVRVREVMRLTGATKEKAEALVADPVRYAAFLTKTRSLVDIDEA
jgi:hypothetical protein